MGLGSPLAFIHKDTGPWVFGLVANNIWTFDGPFFSYHFGDGLALSSSPQITANWIANGNKWTVLSPSASALVG